MLLGDSQKIDRDVFPGLTVNVQRLRNSRAWILLRNVGRGWYPSCARKPSHFPTPRLGHGVGSLAHGSYLLNLGNMVGHKS